MQINHESECPKIQAAKVLELVCSGECIVSRLCVLANATPVDVETALVKLENNGYVVRAGEMVRLKEESSVENQSKQFCGHLKHPSMSRIPFEFETDGGVSEVEIKAAAFDGLKKSLQEAGVELEYLEI